MEDCCLLCLQPSDDKFWDGIKADTGIWQEWNIKTVLEKHFWSLKEVLLPSSWICFNCWKNVRDFHKFYLRVEEAHIHAGKLRKIKTELQSNDNLEPEMVINQSTPLRDRVGIKTASSFDEPDLKNPNQSTIEEKESKTKTLTDDEERHESEPDVSNSYSSDCDSDFLIMQHFKKINCDLCEAELEDFADMQKHFKNVHKEVGYMICCNRKFYHRYRLVDHIHVHLNPEHFKCDQCGKILSDRAKLKTHMSSVHLPVPAKLNYPCDICGEAFPTAYALRRHKNTHMPEEEKKFACSDCGQLFASLFELNLHKDASILENFKIVCDICGLILYTTTDHTSHMNKHADPVTQFDCDICNLRLTNESDLNIHLQNKHPVYGKEGHKCPICAKISPSLRGLKGHISSVHDSGCGYICRVCKKTFRGSKSFKEHMDSSHKGAELYTCPWCPKSFTLKRNMKAHSKRKHPKEWEEEQLTESVSQH